MNTTLDTVIVGGGAMGSAAAWALAARGRDVTLLEQFTPGHHKGASHGATRNLSLAYAEPEYVAMLAETLKLWAELEEESGEQLLARTGVVNHGPDPHLGEIHAALNGAGLRADFVPLAEAGERWRGIRFDQQVLHMPDGGQLNPEAALPAVQRLAARKGAAMRHGVKVVGLDILDDGVRHTVDDSGRAEVLTARQAVVTAGGWTSKLLAGSVATPRLTVTQEQPAHFGITDDGASWPGFNHFPGEGRDYAGFYSPVYGMLTPGEGIKAGWHGVGPVVDPDLRSYLPEPRQRAALQQYARDWLPGVDADAMTDISCTYTTAPDHNFVLDRIGPVVIGAGFAGHGFKFTPVVGRILADLATGEGPAPAIFAASRA